MFIIRRKAFVLPDATSTIQVLTVHGYDLLIASNPKIIADTGVEESSVSEQIKSGALETQVLPYDLTMYDQIKLVILIII